MRGAALGLKVGAALALGTAADASSNVERFTLVQNSSEISAKVRFLGLASKTATFPSMRGTVSIDRSDTRDMRLSVTLDARHLRASDTLTRDRLKGESFFWVDRHPLIEFRGSDLMMEDSRNGYLSGRITARGVTRSVDLDVTFDRPIEAINGTGPITIEAETEIDRTDFGMDDYGGVVGRTVKIRIEALMQPEV
ncbi:YceI family protein [Sphingomicrobium sediminis]|uniref:YceI family protein n=1 Tax=Sphingomicrobium sediminis TaxID=2950949 RepID=A0A9X2EE51_9SPHN|nr:YceI family protein [Sphingomicrobium sediminis]MCM8556290.1 YceI family protein [Sphingomicrobium sediminis]